MCGICGILNFGKDGHIDKEILHRMCNVLEHRGPDDEGYFIGTSNNGQTGRGRFRDKETIDYGS